MRKRYISCVLGSALLVLNLTDSCLADDKAPGIYIKKVVDRSFSIVPGIKAQYELCADQRALYKKIYEQSRVGWEAIREDLPEGYDVLKGARPEPDWQKLEVGKDIEKEYFLGNKYAVYNYNKDYEISEADRCALVVHEDLDITIDNGVERFQILLQERLDPGITPGAGKIALAKQYSAYEVTRNTSPVKIREENDKALQEISKDERITRLLSMLLSSTEGGRTPGAKSGIDSTWNEKLKDAMGYEEDNATPVVVPRANDEHVVAHQACDIISASNLNTRLWYWSKMHHYPAAMERPILLKSEVTNRLDEVMMVEEAVSFKVLSEIDDAVFEVDPSLK